MSKRIVVSFAVVLTLCLPGLAAFAAAPADVTPAVAPDAPVNLQSGLSCTLSVTSSSCIGDKTRYELSSTASGCTGPYSFSWSNANQTSGTTDNPNTAVRVLTPGEPCSTQVCVTVTSNGLSCMKCRTLWKECGVTGCGGPTP